MGRVNRVAVHQSVLGSSDPVVAVLDARAAGIDAIGLHVASVAAAERAWGGGAGTPLLAGLVDALLVSRVTVLDVGRIDLAEDASTDPQGPRHRVLDLAGRLGAQFVTVRAADGEEGGTADAFAALTAQARAFRVRPLLVPAPGTAVPDVRTALAVVGDGRGGVVLDVRPATDDVDEIADLVVEAGDALGYVRVPAGGLAPDMGPATSLLATVPPQVPVVIGTLGDAPAAPAPTDPTDPAARVRDGAVLAACRAGIDRLLVHPRAVAAERGFPAAR
jgi:hypothetical protein